jgi:hypothetical protein
LCLWSQLLATLKYNEANLRAARAQLAKLEAQPRPEEVPPSEAKVKVAEASVELQRDLVTGVTERKASASRCFSSSVSVKSKIAGPMGRTPHTTAS